MVATRAVLVLLSLTLSSWVYGSETRYMVVADAGLSFIHPSVSTKVMKAGVEAGISDPVTKSLLGLYYSQHLGVASQFGATIRFCFPSSRLFWVQLNLDLIGLVLGALGVASGGVGTMDPGVFRLAGWGLATGLRFEVNESFSLLPYVSYDSFGYPYSSSYQRYYAPAAGLKIAYSF